MKILAELFASNKKIKQVNQWLKMEVERFRKEQKQFSSENNFVFGTDKIPDFVAPIPPNSLRATVSSPSLAGYLIVADGWYFLISWLLKKRATILDIGCGCGKLARLFLHHPFIEKYFGLIIMKKVFNGVRNILHLYLLGNFSLFLWIFYLRHIIRKGKLGGVTLYFP